MSFWKRQTHEINVAFWKNKLSTLQRPNCTLSELQNLWGVSRWGWVSCRAHGRPGCPHACSSPCTITIHSHCLSDGSNIGSITITIRCDFPFELLEEDDDMSSLTRRWFIWTRHCLPPENKDVPEYSGAVRINAMQSPPACFIILAFLLFSILGNHRFLQQSQHQQCRGTVWVEKWKAEF